MTPKGKFITFEGCNGTGKSTHSKILVDELNALGKRVVFTREPGGTPAAESIRNLLRNERKLHNITELLLMFAARNEHFINFIKPHIDAGDIVVCDRFFDSSLVFQGVLNGIDIEYIMQLKQMIVGDFEPDITVLIDADFKSVAHRISSRTSSEDKYDFLQQADFEKIRNAYKKMAEIFFDRYIVIKSNAAIRTVADRILKAVKPALHITN